ncbi:MAG: DUF4258 domain-containing protein [Patescibacteria group bacterium]
MIIFTDHARIRMAERSISRAQTTKTIKEPDRIIEEDDQIKIFRKSFGDTTLEVVAEIKKLKIVIITVYRL